MVSSTFVASSPPVVAWSLLHTSCSSSFACVVASHDQSLWSASCMARAQLKRLSFHPLSEPHVVQACFLRLTVRHILREHVVHCVTCDLKSSVRAAWPLIHQSARGGTGHRPVRRQRSFVSVCSREYLSVFPVRVTETTSDDVCCLTFLNTHPAGDVSLELCAARHLSLCVMRLQLAFDFNLQLANGCAPTSTNGFSATIFLYA